MSSPWSSGADTGSIWNSNSPNLNLLRRYSLRTSSLTNTNNNNTNGISTINNIGNSACSPLNSPSSIINHSGSTLGPKSTCSWEPSGDGKYLVGYIVISRQDLEIYHAALGFQLCGGKLTHDCQLGAIVEHVVPGSLANIVCKLKVGDEIVEWNGFNLRNKRNDEVCDIIESVKNTHSLRLVAIRPAQNSNNTSNNTNSNNNSSQQNSGVSSKATARPVD